MDERLEKALAHANYKITLATARKNLELKFQNALLYSHNGGIFTVTRELLTFVDTLVGRGHIDGVLIDDKGNPIRVDDLKAFGNEIEGVYFQATNAYHVEFEKLRKARNVKTIVGQ